MTIMFDLKAEFSLPDWQSLNAGVRSSRLPSLHHDAQSTTARLF